MIITDPALQNLLGYGYTAEGWIETQAAASYSCGGTSRMEPYTISWLPVIKGFPVGGSQEGEMTNPSCIGSTALVL